MKARLPRPLAVAAVLCACAAGNARAAEPEPVLRPEKLVILSTTDVKGKTSPCGCKIPRGGLARLAHYVEGVRAEYGQVALVDNGGFHPDLGRNPEPGAFLMDALEDLGAAAVGLGSRDVRFGIGYLRAGLARTRLPLVCANLIAKDTGRTLVDPWRIATIGTVKVGFFGLIGELVPGAVADSLQVEDPTAAARRAVAELREGGAQVVVALSQLGKTRSEALANEVEGIDAMIVGYNTPMLARGRTIGKTIACFGGDQGQYVCRTELSLDASRHPVEAEAHTVSLGPEVPHQPEMLNRVKSFEDAQKAKTAREKPPVQTGSLQP